LVTSVGTRRSAIWIHDPNGERSLSSEGEIVADISGPSFVADDSVLYYLLQHGSDCLGPELWRMTVRSGKSEAVFPGIPMAAYDVGQSGDVAPAVRALMDKVGVAADDSMMSGFPAQWPAAVRVHSGGVMRERTIIDVPGDPTRPLTARDVAEKFHRLADRIVGAEMVDKLIDATRSVLDGGATPMQLLTQIGHATEK
jgi:hypothetical protein